MKKYLFLGLLTVTGAVVLTSCINLATSTKNLSSTNGIDTKSKYNIVYFAPEVYPDIEEIKFPSYQAFFSGVSDRMSRHENMKMTRIDTPMEYDNVDVEMIKEICLHNNSNVAIVPKIKYFKVGIGKYVFSNQVVVSMKMYDAQGNFIGETSYDTYKKNKKILGNTENSIKEGTVGAMNEILKGIRNINRHSDVELPASEEKEFISIP